MTWTTSAARGEALAKRHWTAFQEKPVRFCLVAVAAVYLIALEFERSGTSIGRIGDQATVELSLLTITPTVVAMCAGLLFALLQFAQPNALVRSAQVHRALPPRRTQISPPPATVNALGTEAHEGLMSRLNHDLRTPLNAMLGFADLMNAETFGPLGDERYRAYAAHMQTCGRELLRATETTLAMAALLTRPHPSEHVSSRLKDLVLAAWADATNLHTGNGCTLALQLPDDMMVRGDAHAIQQGLINLLGAAIARAGASAPVSVQAIISHGRINTSISVLNGQSLRPATTGCRALTSAWPNIEDMPIAVSRTLFGLQGIPLVEAMATSGQWSVSLSLEAASQADLFDERRSLEQNVVPKRCAYHSTDFFGVTSLSSSRSV